MDTIYLYFTLTLTTHCLGTSGSCIGGCDFLRSTRVVCFLILGILFLRACHGFIIILERQWGKTRRVRRDTTCLLVLVCHLIPLLRNHSEKFAIWNIRVFLLEFFTNIVLKENVGGRGAFWRVRISGFASSLLYIGILFLVNRFSLPAFSRRIVRGWHDWETCWARKFSWWG